MIWESEVLEEAFSLRVLFSGVLADQTFDLLKIR